MGDEYEGAGIPAVCIVGGCCGKSDTPPGCIIGMEVEVDSLANCDVGGNFFSSHIGAEGTWTTVSGTSGLT